MENLDVRSFILQTDDANDSLNAKETNVVNTKKPSINYEIVLKDNADLVIRRKTAKTSKLLVILISQSQFYIKDENNGKIEMINKEDLKNFTNGIDKTLDIGCDFWLSNIYPGKAWVDDFISEISSEGNVQAIKEGRHVFGGRMNDGPSDAISMWYAKEVAKRNGVPLAEAVWAGEDTLYFSKWRQNPTINHINYEIISIFGAQFGLDNAKKVLNSYLDMGTDLLPTSPRVMFGVFAPANNIGCGKQALDKFKDLKHRDFMVDKFVDYFVYQLIREGFRGDPDSFWQNVGDAYRMQLEIYGKIKEKYPENILTYHNQLAYIRMLHKKEINSKRWTEAVNAETRYEYKGEKYSIISPLNPDDMYEEARQQCNCLASYIDRVINKECMIFFMRKNSNIDTSLVTIEVYPDLEIGQVKAKNNRTPNMECMKFVEEWERKVLAPARMAVAV